VPRGGPEGPQARGPSRSRVRRTAPPLPGAGRARYNGCVPPADAPSSPAARRERRRRFLQAVAVAASAALLWAWRALGRDRRARARPGRVTLPQPAADGVTFHGDVILVRWGQSVTALASRCPHLGCRIDRSQDGVLHCPCHGSRFDAAGRRLAGPADADLARLAVAPSREPGKVDVDLSA
jgi:cytochrome b6-f complex iron-sulfur subunit